MKMKGFMKILLFAWVAGWVAASAEARRRPELAPTPPMGWNSWNGFGKQRINERIVHEVIDAMVVSGLRDAGYRYVVVDGGWRDVKLGPNGELLPHPVKFPHGMKVLADYARSRGLKFGLHAVPGTHDCGGDPVGGLRHEAVQLKQFVDWRLDFVKLDKCRCDEGWTEDLLKAVYFKWSDLLANCGRDVVLSVSAYTNRPWYSQACNMARTTGDIRAVFDGVKRSVMDVALQNNEAAAAAGRGYWNDPDMLETGEHGMTQEEQKSHFALWCVMTAPLMLGDDPRVLTPGEKEILLNRDAIAIDQDPTEQGRRIKADGDAEIWAKKLGGNRMAVLLLNRNGAETKSVSFSGKDVGFTGDLFAKDVYAEENLGAIKSSLTRALPPRGCALLLVWVQ